MFFFCQKDGNKVHPLLKASTDKVGQKLRNAVELSKNEVLVLLLTRKMLMQLMLDIITTVSQNM